MILRYGHFAGRAFLILLPPMNVRKTGENLSRYKLKIFNFMGHNRYRGKMLQEFHKPPCCVASPSNVENRIFKIPLEL